MAEWAIAFGVMGTFISMVWAIVGYLIPIKTDVAGIKVQNAGFVERLDRQSDAVRRVKDKQKQLEQDSGQTILIVKTIDEKVKEQEARLDRLTHEHDWQMGAGGCGHQDAKGKDSGE